MLFQVLADLVLLLHASFIAFVVFGALFAIRWPRIVWLHLPACIWAAILEFCGFICPLTPLENRLRRAGGEASYAEGFIEHYLVPFVYPPGLTPRLQVLLGVVVVLVNGLLYWCVLRYRRSRARSRTPSA
jgi:hypothetical protein